MVLQQKIAERTKLLSQLEQAKMQEQVSASLRSMSEIAAPGTTPSLDGSATRSSAGTPTRWVPPPSWLRTRFRGMLEVQQASVQMAGHSRLEQIRASMRGMRYRPGCCGARHTRGDAPGRTPTRTVEAGFLDDGEAQPDRPASRNLRTGWRTLVSGVSTSSASMRTSPRRS